MTDRASFVWYDESAPINWDAWDRLINYNWKKNKDMNEQHFCDTINVEGMIQNMKNRNGELYRYMQSQAKVIADLRMSTYIGGSLENSIATLIKHWGFSKVMTELAKKAPR